MSLPRIRSESPAFDMHHPEVAALEMVENYALGKDGEFADAPEMEGRARHLEKQMGESIESATDETKRTDEDDR